MLHLMGIETGVDLDAVIAIARRLEEIVGHPLESRILKAGKTSDLALRVSANSRLRSFYAMCAIAQAGRIRSCYSRPSSAAGFVLTMRRTSSAGIPTSSMQAMNSRKPSTGGGSV